MSRGRPCPRLGLGALGVDALDIEGAGNAGTGIGQVGKIAAGDHLNDKVADAGTFDGAGEHGEPAGIGRHLVEVVILAAAAHDVDARVVVARKLTQALDGLGIRARKAAVVGTHDLAHGVRDRLAALGTGLLNLLDHGVGGQETVVVDIDIRLEGLSLAAERTELVKANLMIHESLVRGLALDIVYAVDLATDGLVHPQAHDVLEEAIALEVAALIGKVLLAGELAGDSVLVLNAQQAPRSARDVDGVVILGGNGQEGRASVVRGRQHHGRGVTDLLGDVGRELAEHGAGHGRLQEDALGNTKARKDLGVPRALLGVEHAGSARVGVLVGLDAGQTPVEIVGDHQEGTSCLELLGMLVLEGEQLIERVERLTLNAGAGIDLGRIHNLVGNFVDAVSAGIAVGDRITDDLVVLIEQHEINTPGIDSDGGRSLSGLILDGAQACDNMVEQSLNVPAVVAVYALLLVIEAVDLLVGHLAVLDPAGKNATARGTDIDRCVLLGLDATLHVLSPY